MLKIDVISVQPQMFRGFLEESIVARAVKKGACEINIVDLRPFGEGRWKKVDDKPYGGGPGMLMKCGPWFAAVEHCLQQELGGWEVGKSRSSGIRIIMTSPKGKTFTQRDAEALAGLELPNHEPRTTNHEPRTANHLIFLCGHYEGFDARIETLATDQFSLGDFVMTGGELAAAAMVDAIVRLLPGVLGGGSAATSSESFGSDGRLEPPQYTHPPEFRGLKVPEVLLSGDHRKIEAWKASESRKLTERLRPDLLK
jgi:tRNA (guanine37-N1)-methyltransferase